MTLKDRLLDLLFQLTEYKMSDVEWCYLNEPSDRFIDNELSILHVKLRCGKFLEVCNQFGNLHVITVDTASCS